MDLPSREPEDLVIRIGAGYPAMQLARALAGAAHGDDPALRSRAQAKVARWTAALLGQLGGSIAPGSRAPVAGLPVWATLEVVTGGFATGDVLSGGPLRDHELALMQGNGIPVEPVSLARQALNAWFLTEPGQERLRAWLQSGCYELDVPEEAALLVVASLVQQGHAEPARSIVEELAPYFSRMRFYPRPTEQARPSGTRVCLETAGATAERLAAVTARRQILEQKESVTVWTPLYDNIVALFLETVVGDVPVAQREHAGSWQRSPNGTVLVLGGWPCAHYPEGWHARADVLLDHYTALRQHHRLCKRPEQKDSSLGLLLVLLRCCVTTPERFTGREAGRVRLALARYVAKRGLPLSATCVAQRDRQWPHAAAPTHRMLAQQLARRLRAHPAAEGLEDIAPVVRPIDADEAILANLPSGTLIPTSLARKVERCLIDTVDALVRRGLVTSGEVLAVILPKVTSGLRAQGIPDPMLRSLYGRIYKAFRQRRSLLLLNLEKQVQLEELPWVAAINALRLPAFSGAELTKQALKELATLAITFFPHAILPNKLVGELDGLAQASGLDLPLTEEVAADIFMGRFSGKYAEAAHQAWGLIGGTRYARYYGVSSNPAMAAEQPGRRRTAAALPPADVFSALCESRAGPRPSGRSVAYNGSVIEQQQILTTHNLAVLVHCLGLGEVLAPQAEALSRACFVWVIKRLQIPVADWHARLIHIKNAAYAWRQMVFFLSLCPDDRVSVFMDWAETLLAGQPEAFAGRFRPAMQGLVSAGEGAAASSGQGRIFLGWVQGRHWLA